LAWPRRPSPWPFASLVEQDWGISQGKQWIRGIHPFSHKFCSQNRYRNPGVESPEFGVSRGVPENEGRARGIVFEELRKKHRRCMYPTADSESPDLDCSKPAIRAHSIQNGGTLAELCEDDHVYVLQAKPTLAYEPEMPEFVWVGRNRATTFTGLCNEHDTKLFRPIERAPLDLSNPEHVFLMTYRSALRGAHAGIENARWTSNAAKRLSEEEHTGPYEGGIGQYLSAYPMLAGMQAFMEKARLDHLYLRADYGEVLHKVVPLPESEPSVAANAFCSVGKRGTEWVFCALNVFPANGKHLMVFSYRRRNRRFVERFVDKELMMTYGTRREQAASKVLLDVCETITLKPSHRESLGAEQSAAIGGYFFWSTLEEFEGFLGQMSPEMSEQFMESVRDVPNRVSGDNPRINLFRPVA
jgi:hypothetical protein